MAREHLVDWRIWLDNGIWHAQAWHTPHGAKITAEKILFVNIHVEYVPPAPGSSRWFFRATHCECKASLTRSFFAEQDAHVEIMRLVPLSQTVDVPVIKMRSGTGRPR